jgi:Tol biopolymer transport system component
VSRHLSILSTGLGALMLLSALEWGASATDRLEQAAILATPPMARPAYLQPVTDPTMATVLTRVTDPGRPMAAGIVCDPNYCRHRYSSTQAWNADQTLLAITKGCNGYCFLDGQSYQPVFHRAIDDDCKWHPTDPALLICVRSSQVYAWAPRTSTRRSIYTPKGYTNLQFGPYKGNLSQDGNRLVIRATNAAGALVAFVYDIAEQKKYPDIEIATLPGLNDYCGISPSGRYVACLSTKDDRTDVAYILTVDGTLVQSWTEHHRPGHGDMTVDADGSEVYVGISKAHPDKWHIIKRRLSDGVVTKLAPAGYGAHASTRNSNRPGWVFVSYEGTHGKVAGATGYAPFYQEIVALRIDGSGEIRRIAQTRNVVEAYIGETHASPSPDGSQVVWSSNWGIAGGPVADYVSRLSWPK